MSAWSDLGTGKRTLIVAAIAISAVGAGYFGWQRGQPAPEAANLSVPPDDPAPAADVAAAEAGPEAEPASSVVAAPVWEPAAPDAVAGAAPAPSADVATDAPPTAPPEFDNWRVEPDGDAVVSGRAAPGARVEVLVDGAPVAEVAASGSGEFAALFTLPPNDQPSLMTLTMTPPEGDVVPSMEMVALSAISGPEQIATEAAAEAAPMPEPAPAAILVTDEGALVLQDGQPAVQDQDVAVSIDTISYSPDGTVQIGGRGTGGATIQLYLDNAPLQSVPVSDDASWFTTLEYTPPGLYTLRVDQIDATGKVTSRFETPFKRETLEALAAASAPTEPTEAQREESPLAGGDKTETAKDVSAVPLETGLASEAPSTGLAADTSPQPVTITVQPGFTLWGIAQETFGDGVMYVQVFEANRDKIRNPDLIYPGQVFAIPSVD